MVGDLLSVILPTFGVVGVGLLCRKTGVWDHHAVRALNAYAYAVALPALIFQAVFQQFATATPSLADLRYLLGLLLGHLVVFAVGLLVCRGNEAVQAIGPMLLAFGSTAYLGIPFATYAFGPQGTAYAALGSVTLVVGVLFAALWHLNRHGARAATTTTLRQLLELPFLWMTLAGIMLPLVGLRALPAFLDRTLDVIAGSAGPTALLALGAFQFDLRIDRIPWRSAIPLGVGKVVLPAALSGVALLALGVTGLPLAVGMALGATSVAVTAFVLSDEYHIGRELTAGAIAASTITSLAALSGIAWWWIR